MEKIVQNYSFGTQSESIQMDGHTAGEVIKLIDLSYEYIVSIRETIVDNYGIEEYEELLKHVIWNSKVRVSFSDFCEFHNVRNRFQGFFLRNYTGDIYGSQSFYPGFAQRNPTLNEELLQTFSKCAIWDDLTDSDKKSLYEAYVLMIADPLVKSNLELFQ